MKETLPLPLQPLFEELKRILKDTRHMNKKEQRELKALGFELYGSSHLKMRIGNSVYVFGGTNSDRNAYRQQLRTIRKILIKEYKEGNFKI